ncbi:MAG: DUF1266 domain-containing protein [Nitrospirae bacterium]|nr:DUF1266 domain-containing protein [Nitrospirota bacterium]
MNKLGYIPLSLLLIGICSCQFAETRKPEAPAATQVPATASETGAKLYGQLPVPPGTPEAWGLACSALLTERNRERHDLLAGNKSTDSNIEIERRVLSSWWGIKSRGDLNKTLKWLEEEGHRADFEKIGRAVAPLSDSRFAELIKQFEGEVDVVNKLKIAREYYGKLGTKSLIGWDYARYVFLCRKGYLIGYLSEEEAWNRIAMAATTLQRTFGSWEELGENYLIGRSFWSYEQTQHAGSLFRDDYQKLLSDPQSPWRLNPWDISLSSMFRKYPTVMQRPADTESVK